MEVYPATLNPFPPLIILLHVLIAKQYRNVTLPQCRDSRVHAVTLHEAKLAQTSPLACNAASMGFTTPDINGEYPK